MATRTTKDLIRAQMNGETISDEEIDAKRLTIPDYEITPGGWWGSSEKSGVCANARWQKGDGPMPRYEIVAVYADAEDSEAHPEQYHDVEQAGLAAVGLAWADAFGAGGNHLVRNDQRTSVHDLETWCADAPIDAPIWAVRQVGFLRLVQP